MADVQKKRQRQAGKREGERGRKNEGGMEGGREQVLQLN